MPSIDSIWVKISYRFDIPVSIMAVLYDHYIFTPLEYLTVLLFNITFFVLSECPAYAMQHKLHNRSRIRPKAITIFFGTGIFTVFGRF